MSNMLQKRHGTAFITYLIREVLNKDLPAGSPLGTGNSTKQQLATRLAVAYSLHLQQQPITSRALVEAGCSNGTKANYTLEHFVAMGVFARVQKLAAHGRGRSFAYEFTDQFAKKIEAIHNGIGTDD
jgi:hypothetical protein